MQTELFAGLVVLDLVVGIGCFLVGVALGLLRARYLRTYWGTRAIKARCGTAAAKLTVMFAPLIAGKTHKAHRRIARELHTKVKRVLVHEIVSGGENKI